MNFYRQRVLFIFVLTCGFAYVAKSMAAASPDPSAKKQGSMGQMVREQDQEKLKEKNKFWKQYDKKKLRLEEAVDDDPAAEERPDVDFKSERDHNIKIDPVDEATPLVEDARKAAENMAQDKANLSTTLDFSPKNISGGIKKPSNQIITLRKTPRLGNMIPIRQNFDDEIFETFEELP